MITESKGNGKTLHCPVCGQRNLMDAITCQNCGGALPSSHRRPVPAADVETEAAISSSTTVVVPSIKRSDSKQQCPMCGELNRPGEILCQACGTNLTTGQPAPYSTNFARQQDTPDAQHLFDSAVAETLRVGRYETRRPVGRPGTATFETGMILSVQVLGYEAPLLLCPLPNVEIVFGRRDLKQPTIDVDVDLTPYLAYVQGVSRRHAIVKLNGTKLVVWDLHSSNGTYVSGQKLTPGQPATLNDGCELCFGQMIFRVSFHQKGNG